MTVYDVVLFAHITAAILVFASLTVDWLAVAGLALSSQCVKASGNTHRRHYPRPCPLSVRELAPKPAHSPRPPGPADSHDHF
jgi:hypothetical protein